MGDPEQKHKRSQRRKRNYIAKKLWEDKRYRPQVHEVRHYEDEDWQDEVADYLSEAYCVSRRK